MGGALYGRRAFSSKYVPLHLGSNVVIDAKGWRNVHAIAIKYNNKCRKAQCGTCCGTVCTIIHDSSQYNKTPQILKSLFSSVTTTASPRR